VKSNAHGIPKVKDQLSNVANSNDPVRYGFTFLLVHHIGLIPIPNNRSQIVEAQNCSMKAWPHEARTPSSASWLYDWSTHSSLVLCTSRELFTLAIHKPKGLVKPWPWPLCVTSCYTGFFLMQCAVNFFVGEHAS
jgi:hypothetical protein